MALKALAKWFKFTRDNEAVGYSATISVVSEDNVVQKLTSSPILCDVDL